MSDGNWLSLCVAPTGRKTWRLGFKWDGKETSLTIGTYPKMTLGQARRDRDRIRELVAEGRHPDGKRKPLDHTRSVCEISRQWIRKDRATWSHGHALRLERLVERDIVAQIGDRDIRDVGPKELLDLIRKVEDRGTPKTARLVKSVLSRIQKFAVAQGIIVRDATADLGPALAKPPRTVNRKQLERTDLARFFAELKASDIPRKFQLAIMIIAHTGVRTNELTGGRWSEIQGDCWYIPAERMKMGRPHDVPLTAEVKALFAELRLYCQSEDMLPCRKGELLDQVYRMGWKGRMSIHGLRGTMSTMLHERFPELTHVIERQLSHIDRNATRAAYSDAAYKKARWKLLNWYSRELARHGATVLAQPASNPQLAPRGANESVYRVGPRPAGFRRIPVTRRSLRGP